MAYFSRVDIVTSGAKALLIEGATGETVGDPSAEYPLPTSRLLWAEQEPAGWWKEVVNCVRALLHVGMIDPYGYPALKFPTKSRLLFRSRMV